MASTTFQSCLLKWLRRNSSHSALQISKIKQKGFHSQGLCFLEAAEQTQVAKTLPLCFTKFQFVYIGIQGTKRHKSKINVPGVSLTVVIPTEKYFQEFLPVMNDALLWIGFFRKPINTKFSQYFGKIQGKAQKSKLPWSSVFMQHLICFIFTTLIGLFEVIF